MVEGTGSGSPGFRVVGRTRFEGIRLGALLMGLGLAGCFTDLAVPSCRVLGDCPAIHTACKHGYCFHRNTGCEEAPPTPGDGCCSGWETDRSPDDDCRTFDLALGFSEFTQAAIRKMDGAIFLHGRAPKDGRVHLLEITPQGELVWDLPLTGNLDPLLPPVILDDRTLLSPVETGIQVVDLDRRQAVDLIPCLEPPMTPVSASEETLAWVDRSGSVHFHRLPSGPRIVLPGMGDRWPPIHSRRTGWFLVVGPDGTLRGLSPEATVSSTAVAESLVLGETVSAPPIVVGTDLFLATASGSLISVAVAGHPWHRRWEVFLGGTVHLAPLVDSRGLVLVVREDGTLFVIRENEGRGVVVGSVPLAGTGRLGDLAVTEEGRILLFREGRLRSLRIRQEGGGVAFSEGWSFSLEGRRGIATLLARRLVIALDSGHLVGLVSPEGPDQGPWSRPLADETNRLSVP